MRTLDLRLLPSAFAIVRLAPNAGLPWWAAASDGLLSFTRTPDETSVVCEEHRVPAGVRSERGYRAVRIEGVLSFEETGVLSSLATPLATAGVPIFVISTFDTDHILVRDHQLDRAIDILRGAGHLVTDDEKR